MGAAPSDTVDHRNQPSPAPHSVRDIPEPFDIFRPRRPRPEGAAMPLAAVAVTIDTPTKSGFGDVIALRSV